jgi:hypothetical protein
MRECLVRFDHAAPGPRECIGLSTTLARRSGRVTHVQFIGVTARQLRCVQIRRDEQIEFQLDSVPDGRTGTITAGELVTAMALEFGRGGLSVDLRIHAIAIESIGVEWFVASPDRTIAEQVRVVLSLDS